MPTDMPDGEQVGGGGAGAGGVESTVWHFGPQNRGPIPKVGRTVRRLTFRRHWDSADGDQRPPGTVKRKWE